MSLTTCSREAPKPSHGHRIFLSHSGVNKDFVGDLAEFLRRYHYDPFFDKDSLEAGGIANMTLILETMKTSKLALFVLSEEFFTHTKNPMLELLAAVEHKVRMLPLFYDLLAPEVKDVQRRASWKAIWREWSRSDPERIDAEKCDQAVEQLADVTGIEYKRGQLNIFDYRLKIAEAVCRIVPPDRRPFDDNIVGKHRLCLEVDSMFECSPVVHESCRVLALHGMESMGKTMLCNALYNFYFDKFVGRVCHLKLDEQSQLQCINNILIQLMNVPRPGVSTKDEALRILVERLPHSKNFFLIFDNIQGSLEYEKMGQLFLERLPFPKGTKVLLLARSKSILERLLKPIYCKGMIAEFPSLNVDEAKSLFLGKSIFYAQDKKDSARKEKEICTSLGQNIIDRCLNLCTVKRNKHDEHPFFHPHILESIAVYIKDAVNIKRLERPEWTSVLKALEKDRTLGMIPMFNKLQQSFKSLSEDARSLFLEIALYWHAKDGKWLHPSWQDMDDITKCLKNLRDAAFLSKDDEISDIHTQFAKKSVRDCAALIYAECKQLEDKLSVSDILINKRKDCSMKVAFKSCNFMFRNAALNLSNRIDIEVLLLDDNKGLETVNLGRNRLRYVDIRFQESLNVEARSAQVIGFSMESKMASRSMHQDFSLPSICFQNLQIFELSGMHLKPWKVSKGFLSGSHSLKFAHLHNVKLTDGNALELSHGVKKLKLFNLQNLKTMDISSLHELEHFEVDKCTELLELHLPCSLKQCNISCCDVLQTVIVGTNDLVNRMRELRNLSDMPSACDDAESIDEDEYSKKCFVLDRCRDLIQINGLSELTSIYDFYFNFANETGKLLKLRRFEDDPSFRWIGPTCDSKLKIS